MREYGEVTYIGRRTSTGSVTVEKHVDDLQALALPMRPATSGVRVPKASGGATTGTPPLSWHSRCAPAFSATNTRRPFIIASSWR